MRLCRKSLATLRICRKKGRFRDRMIVLFQSIKAKTRPAKPPSASEFPTHGRQSPMAHYSRPFFDKMTGYEILNDAPSAMRRAGKGGYRFFVDRRRRTLFFGF